MKKILSVLLSALIILSVFSVVAFATEAEPTKLEKWGETYDWDNGISVKTRILANNISLDILFNIVTYMKDGKTALIINFDGKEFKAVTKDDALCIFMTKLPLFHYKITGSIFNSIDSDLTSENLSFVRGYEAEYEEKTFYVEEYLYESDDQSMTLKFYFDGDELKVFGSEEKIDDMDTEIYFEIIPGEIDDEVFEMPWYSIDVTRLVDFILMLGIVSL